MSLEFNFFFQLLFHHMSDSMCGINFIHERSIIAVFQLNEWDGARQMTSALNNLNLAGDQSVEKYHLMGRKVQTT